MALDILYFSWVREAIGRDSEQVEPPAGVTTVTALLDWLETRGGGYQEALADRGRLRAALDQAFVPLGAALGEARELAIFPPVTGG
jgi:molybdopterin synthase sulfur carrier subunit